MRLVRKAIALLALCGAAFFALLAVAAQGGRFTLGLDTLTHLTPAWLTAGIVFAIVAVVLGETVTRRAAVVAGLVTLLSGALLMGPELVGPQPSTQVQPHAPLTILQFNLWAHNRDPARTLSWIEAQDADVLLLEEAEEQSGPIVQGLRQTYPYLTDCTGRGGCETIILSKTAPVSTKPLSVRGEGHAPVLGAAATFNSASGPFTVIAVHLARPTFGRMQAHQIGGLQDVIAAMPARRLILGGDFNAAPWSFILKDNDRRLALTRRTRNLASFPAARRFPLGLESPWPVLPIDHIYAGAGWRTLSVRRGPRLGSDHYPVVAQFAPVD